MERPDAVTATFTARALDEPVEDLSRRTETSKTFVNPDGTSTDEVSAGQQRILDEDGQWQDIDLDLVEQQDGSFAPKVAPSDVVVGKGGSKVAATVDLGDDRSLSVTWPETLPAPTVDGGVATYELSDTTDLLVITTKTGVAARIRLNEPPAADDPAVTMGLKTENLSLDTTARGELQVSDDADKVVATTAPMVAWDAQVDEAGDPTNVVGVAPSLEEVSAKNDVTRSELTLSPEDDFLTDPKTVYPVVIDPDISAVSFSRDTMVRNGATSPQGTDARLWAGRIAESSSEDPWISYVQWNNTQLTDKTILAATAKFYQYGAGGCGKQINLRALTGAFTEGGTVFSNRPGFTSTNGANSTAGPCNTTNGWLSVNVKNMVEGWAFDYPHNYGLQISVPSDYKNNANWTRRFCSSNENSANAPCNLATRNPVLSVTYNAAPTSVSVPALTDDYRAIGSTTFVRTGTPTFKATGVDANSSVILEFQTHTSTAGTSATLKGSCSVVAASGAVGSCKPTGTLTSGTTYYTRVKATDAHGLSIWSGWKTFTVDTATPAFTGVSCTNGYAMDDWYDNAPAASTNCTYTVSNGYDVAFTISNSATGASTTKTVTVSGGTASTGSFDVPAEGAITVRAVATSRSGVATETLSGFGTGPGTITLPTDGDRSTSWFPVEAVGPTAASSAKIQWRKAPETPSPTADWTDAESVATAAGTDWNGSLVSTGVVGKTTPEGLLWDPELEDGIGQRALIETRVVFETPTGPHVSGIKRVTVVPHAFGGSFPTTDLGPGLVSLFTGEFQYSASDASVVGLSVGRSHLSMAGTTGVFGPGWESDLGGDGASGFTVVDRSGTDGSISLVDPEGVSYVYRHSSGTRGALATGTYVPVGENATDNDTLELNAVTGTAGITYRLVLTEADGTKTRWATNQTATAWTAANPATFRVEQVVGPEDNSTTTYGHDSQGRMTWMFAPTPTGVACDTTTRERGCRALELEYTGTGTSSRLTTVWAHLWNPDKSGGAAMDRIAVAQYAYASGVLTEAWDPRISPALKTTYTYSQDGQGRYRLTSVTEPGLKPWQISYDSTGKVDQITRERPSGSTATWSVDYSIGLNATGDGFPDLSPSAAASWGQSDPENQPADGAAVYGPGIGSGLSAADRNEYASLTYFTTQGRVTNTADYGAGRWQIATTGYDDLGNTVFELSPAARLKVLDEGAATASQYATLTVYNQAKEATGGEAAIDAGIRVEQVYGPMREVMTDDGQTIIARDLTETDYDDEVDTGLRPGRPTEIPDGGFNLPVRERASTTTDVAPDPSPTRIDTATTRYEYAPVVTGDGDGWELGSATKTIVGVGTSAESTTITRADAEGRVIQTRTPQGVATGEQSRWTNTVYYTADTSASRTECRAKPEWVDLVCWTGPASQPSGGDIPATATTAYNAWLSPSRVAEVVAGNDRRVTTTNYDTASRATGSEVTTPGVADTDVPSSTVEYDTVTGLATVVTGSGGDLQTAYDSWGRVTSTVDGTGNESTTTYDAAGRVATADDGKGTVAYHYDGTDSSGLKERRGLVTSLETGAASIEAEGSYDADGNLIAQQIGSVSQSWDYDLMGYARSMVNETGTAGQLAYARVANTAGQTRQEQQVLSSQDYTYDGRGRLVKVAETRAADEAVEACWTRTYGFSLDSNRTSLTEYDPNSSNACQASSATRTTSRSFDGADRATLSGYVYDELGRSTTVPAADLTSGTSDVTVEYHANDMVRTLAAGDESQSYDLDAAGRVRRIVTSTGGVALAQTKNYYASSSDSPAWSAFLSRPDASTAWETTWTRYVAGIDGGLALTIDDQGVARVQLSNLDGDVVGAWDLTGDNTDTLTSFSEASEYGTPVTAGGGRYGWLGTHQRDTTTPLADLTLMGVRLYNPATGRFLTRDPVTGGNDNTYTYPPDPINTVDLDGRFAYTLWFKLGRYQAKPRYFFAYFWTWRANYFPMAGVGGGSVGSVWHLNPPGPGSGRVRVIELARTYFTLAALAGHPEAGSKIRFRIVKKGGYLHLKVHAQGPDSNFASSTKAMRYLWKKLVAGSFWGLFAQQLRTLLYMGVV